MRTLQNLGLATTASNIYYRYFHGFNSATPELPAALEWILKVAAQYRCLHDGGDYCEFGVFKGYSFWKAQQEAIKNRLPCRFFGFDSFAGLPAIDEIDRSSYGEFRAGQYECSHRDVVDNLNAAGGVDWRRTFLIPGYFADSLTPELAEKYRIRKVGVAVIDCGLYSSTVDVLRFLRGLIGDKTILVMDDWNCFNADDNRGQRRAIREFLRTQLHLRLEPLVVYGANSQVFVVRSSSAAGGA